MLQFVIDYLAYLSGYQWKCTNYNFEMCISQFRDTRSWNFSYRAWMICWIPCLLLVYCTPCLLLSLWFLSFSGSTCHMARNVSTLTSVLFCSTVCGAEAYLSNFSVMQEFFVCMFMVLSLKLKYRYITEVTCFWFVHKTLWHPSPPSHHCLNTDWLMSMDYE